MEYEIEEEFEQFIQDLNSGLLSHELYLRDDEYQDEYSGNDVEEAQGILVKKIRDYLHEHNPNEYCVFVDWCVRVMSIEIAKKKEIRHYELRVAK